MELARGNTELCDRAEVEALESLTVSKKKWQWEGIFWTGDTEQYFLLVAAQYLNKKINFNFFLYGHMVISKAWRGGNANSPMESECIGCFHIQSV